MSILFDANNPDFDRLPFLQKIEMFFREVCIETPAGITRNTLEEKLEHISEHALYGHLENFRNILVMALEEYIDYGKELARIIAGHTEYNFSANEPVVNITYRLGLDSELLFIKKGGDDLKERANRMAFIALARALDALENLYEMAQKDYELAPAVDVSALFRNFPGDPYSVNRKFVEEQAGPKCGRQEKHTQKSLHQDDGGTYGKAR